MNLSPSCSVFGAGPRRPSITSNPKIACCHYSSPPEHSSFPVAHYLLGVTVWSGDKTV